MEGHAAGARQVSATGEESSCQGRREREEEDERGARRKETWCMGGWVGEEGNGRHEMQGNDGMRRRWKEYLEKRDEGRGREGGMGIGE